jgi:hypothetical protein
MAVQSHRFRNVRSIALAPQLRAQINKEAERAAVPLKGGDVGGVCVVEEDIRKYLTPCLGTIV